MSESPAVRSLRLALLAVALSAGVLACAVWLTGGISWHGARLAARGPLRPIVIAVIALVLYVWLTGPHATRAQAARVVRLSTPARLAFGVALALTCVSLAHNEWNAGGSDAYAYVSEAHLLRHGRVRIEVPLAREAPWPNALQSFTPLGHRPAADGNSIVPIVAPGLPLMMALAQRLAGHCAAFAVPPLTAGLLAWATFVLGRRVRSSAAGLGATCLLATSPTVIAMSKATMSDVPASAFWACALAAAVGASARSAIAAGASASIAILVRPNLAPLAALIAAWMLWRDLATRNDVQRGPSTGGLPMVTRARLPVRALLFGACAMPGCLLVAFFNHAAYGSALTSGYGDLRSLFSLTHVPVNLARYGRWLIETQTWVFLLGPVALVMLTRRLWISTVSRAGAVLLGGTVLVAWMSYLPYVPFDAWWFLRFMLPSWPALCIGTATWLAAIGERGGWWGRAAAVMLLAVMGVHGVRETIARGVFPPGEGERRYATIAQLVERSTGPRTVVIAGQHSGAIRYYAGRLTLSFESLDPAWLDRAVEWLAENGRSPVILLEDWELEVFRKRFAATNRLGSVTLAPVLAYKAHQVPGFVFLFDPRRPDGPTVRPAPIPNPQPACVPPHADVSRP